MSIPVGQVDDAGLAIDAVSVARPRLALAARFAPLPVIANDQRATVEQHRLQACVRTDDRAHLLAEVGKIEEHQAGGYAHHQEAAPVTRRRLGDPRTQRANPDEIREKHVAEQRREQQENDVLGHSTQARSALIELNLLLSLALEQALDRAKQELHVHGLGATPATPCSSHERCHPNDGREDAEHQQHQQHAVSRQERATEQVKLAFDHVEQHGRLTPDA